MSPKLTDVDLLAAVVEHARAHELSGTVISVGVVLDRVRVHTVPRVESTTSDADFARWARSIGATEVLDACPTPSSGLRQYEALGFLDSGVPVTVLVTVYDRPGARQAFVIPLAEFEAGSR